MQERLGHANIATTRIYDPGARGRRTVRPSRWRIEGRRAARRPGMGFPLVGSGRAYNGGQLRSAINLIALVNDAMRRKEVIVRPIPRNNRLGTAPQGGELLLPSGLMAAGHDDRIIGSDVSSSFVSLAHMSYAQAAVLYDYVEALCHAAGTAIARLLRAQSLSPTSPRFFGIATAWSSRYGT